MLIDREELEDDELPADDAEGETPEADDDPADDADESDDDEAEDSEGETPDEDGELVITIGDDKPEPDETAKAPQWVKDLRKADREKSKRIRELEAQLGKGGTTQRKEVGAKPTLAGCNYDEAEYETALDAWHSAKREAEKAERDAADAQAAQEREWQSRTAAHVKAKGALGVKDYDEAEETVFEALDETQRGIIIGGAADSAKLIYALGKNAKALKELAAIKDPVRYTFAVAKLETKLKTTKRRPASAPEATVERSNIGAARTSNAALEKARAKAEKTGDYTQVNRIRRELRGRK